MGIDSWTDYSGIKKPIASKLIVSAEVVRLDCTFEA